MFDFDKELEKYGLTRETYKMVLADRDKKMSGISDDDWSEIIDRYSIKCAPDTFRKGSQTIFGGFFVSKFMEEEGYYSTSNMDKAKEVLGEQYIVKQQIHNDRLKINRIKRELVPSITVAEELSEIMRENNFKIEVPDYVYEPIMDTSQYTMICNISDWHIGCVIDNCCGNSFNWDIANQRVDKYIEECRKYIDIYGIKKVYLINTGDTIESCYLRDTQEHLCEFLQSVQINNAISIIYRTIIALSKDCEVVYGALMGNHDRMSGDKKKNYEGDNANTIITEQIKERIAASNSKRISVIENKYNAKEIRLYINGLSCRFIHGDGIPKLDKGNFAKMMSSENEFFDLLFSGHLHNFSLQSENHGRYMISTGCLSGYNNYSKDFYCTTNASQTICILGDSKVELIKDVILA